MAFAVNLMLNIKIQTHKRFKRTLICYDTDIQSANFRGNPLRQTTKRHLNNSKRLKTMKNEMRKEISFSGLSCCFLVHCFGES